MQSADEKVALSLEARLADVERAVRELASNDAIAKENFASLRNAFNEDLPEAFKRQDEKTRAALVGLDGAIATLRKHAEGMRALLDLLDGRLTRLEVLLETRLGGTVN